MVLEVKEINKVKKKFKMISYKYRCGDDKVWL